MIPMEELIRLQGVERKYHVLLKKYEEVTGTAYTTANPEDVKNTPTDDKFIDSKFNPLMRMRRSYGSSTTLKAFFNAVRKYEEDPARKGHVVGFTLEESEVTAQAGDMKRWFRWMWEAGNFLFTNEGKVYLFI